MATGSRWPGIAIVGGGGAAGASTAGDLPVLGSVALSATFIVVQPHLLAGRDAAAVTAVQFSAGALVALPHALAFEGLPPAAAESGPVVALVALAFAGTVLPFWLFAYGQAHVAAGGAGAFLNLGPLVAVVVGWAGLARPWPSQLMGGVAVLAGIALSTYDPEEGRQRPRSGRPRASRLRPLTSFSRA